MPEPERTPLSSREYAALMSLFAAVSHYSELYPILRRRADNLPGVWDAMKTAEEKTESVIDEILRTVPQKKLRQIKEELNHVKLYIRVERPGCVASLDTTPFSYIETKTVNELLQYVCEHECLMCDRTPTEARKCPYRKMIEDALPHTVNAKDGANCKYADLVLGLEDTDDEKT